MGSASNRGSIQPWLEDADVTLYHGDALTVLRELPDDHVDCIATSPPFFGLRDYGMEGQIGLEPTLEEWVGKLVGVFAEARRVLKPTGTAWIECGDSYNTGTSKSRKGLKPKDLIGQPWELALALRGDGWWLRQAIVWAKPNAMPESATDRCTTAHSYVFLLSKQARYHFDAGAIAEPAEWARWGDQTVPKYEGTPTSAGWMQPRSKAELVALGGRKTNGRKPRTEERRGFDNRLERADGLKNARSVWTIPTEGFPEAHFATWPEALARRIIQAGCPEDGTVLDPFGGSGTTALVARKLGRRAVLIELNEDYCEMASRRLQQQSLLTELSA